MEKLSTKVLIGFLAFLVGVLVFVIFNSSWESAKNQEIESKIKEQSPDNYGIGYGVGHGYGTSSKSDYVPRLHKPTCSDKEILPLWNELKKDKEFKERAKDFYMQADCLEMLDIENIDLNSDGQDESIVWGKNGNLCGATGNCVIWIYEKKKGKYKQILQFYAYRYNDEEKGFEVKKDSSNGYLNILLTGNSSGFETTERSYQFNGKGYEEKQCLFATYYPDVNNPSRITCQEAWKR